MPQKTETHTKLKGEDKVINALLALREQINPPKRNTIEAYVDSKKEIGRNDPCPCGSGLKYKKCCIDNITVYTFEVRHKGMADFHCKIHLTSDDTLHDLHSLIQKAYEWDNDHMYSFMLDNKYRRSKQEFTANPIGEGDTDVTLERLNLSKRKKFLYLFDFGDQHLFEVTVESVDEIKKESKKIKAGYERFGSPPEQYVEWDE